MCPTVQWVKAHVHLRASTSNAKCKKNNSEGQIFMDTKKCCWPAPVPNRIYRLCFPALASMYENHAELM